MVGQHGYQGTTEGHQLGRQCDQRSQYLQAGKCDVHMVQRVRELACNHTIGRQYAAVDHGVLVNQRATRPSGGKPVGGKAGKRISQGVMDEMQP